MLGHARPGVRGILSRGPGLYSTKRIVEAARQRGHEASVVDYLRCYMNIASRRPGVLYGGERLDFDAETLFSYEPGIKGRFFDGALRTNVSAFLMEREDMQANAWVLLPPPNFLSYIDNVDNCENWGI